MEKKSSPATLLPYLNSAGCACYLKIPLAGEGCPGPEGAFPFIIVSESDPLTRLIEAKMVTDGGSEVKKIFLLVQKDQRFLPNDPLWPMNNRAVDDSWRKAFSLFAGQKRDPHLLIFSSQIDEKGEFAPLQPLFFCKVTRLFFAPPCPQCGLPLEQCYDDSLLTRLGLQPYSVSLKRYLYCSSCCSEKGARFYTYELDRSDSAGVGDRWTLIKDLGALLKKKRDDISDFPCSGCFFSEECYGPGLQALARIIAFSFYPFYMFAFEAPSLNALDFLPLVSGSSSEEIEAELKAKQELGRIRCLKTLNRDGGGIAPFLFEKEERFYLEVLYLKLSFLSELMENFFSSGSGPGGWDGSLALDEAWVHFGKNGGFLPFFWNFKMAFIGHGVHPVESRLLPKRPISFGLYSSGMAWFYTLLVNKKQDSSSLHLILGDLVARFLSDQGFSFDPFLDRKRFHAAFSPVNIFWNPEGKSLQEAWYGYWEMALRLGWSLLKSGFEFDRRWRKEEFMGQLSDLREKVKGELFKREAAEPGLARASEARVGSPGTGASEDQAIFAILSAFLGRLPPEVIKEKEALAETLLVPPAGGRDLRLAPPLPEDRKIEKENEIIPETVMLGPSGAAPGRSASLREGETEEVSPVQQIEQRPFEHDFLTETVMLGPTGIASGSIQADSREEPPSPAGMEKTVVLTKTGEEPPEEDFLAETVVVEPGKGRRRK